MDPVPGFGDNHCQRFRAACEILARDGCPGMASDQLAQHHPADTRQAAADSDWTSVSFLLDRKGVIRHIHTGGQYVKGDSDYGALKKKIEELLKEQCETRKRTPRDPARRG